MSDMTNDAANESVNDRAFDMPPTTLVPYPTPTIPRREFPASDNEIGLAAVLIILALAIGVYMVFKRRDERPGP